MKKLSAILLTILICFSLTACQEDEKTAEQPVNQEETTQETIVEEDTKQEESTEAEEITVETVEETTQEETPKDNKQADITAVSYWVNFLNYDGSVLQRTAYKTGETPKYNGSTPTYSDGSYTYTFTGWDKAFSPVTMTQTYKATYSKVAISAGPTIVNPAAKTGLKYDGTEQELITAGSGATFTYSDDNGVTYSATIPTATDAGTYQIKYKKNGVDAGTLEVIIAKATLTKDDLTFNAPTNLVYDGGAKTPSFTNSKGVTINRKYATSITAEDWSTEPPKNVDTYYVKAVIDDDNYNAFDLTDESWKFTISKAKVNVPTAITGLVYNGTEQTGVSSGTGYSVTENKATSAGNYTAIATLSDKDNYEWNLTTPTSDNQNINWSIAKAAPTVTAPTAKTDLVYTGSALELINAGSTSAGTLQYKLGTSGTYSTTIPTATNAGTYTVYYKVVGNDNYNDVAEASVDVTIDVTYTLTGSKVLKASALLATQSSVVTYNNGLCTAYNGYISATSGAKWAGATGFVKALNDAQVAPSGKTYGTGAGQGTWRLLCSNADAQAWVDATTNATSGFGGVYYLWSSMECDTNYAYTCGCFGVYCWKNYTKSFSNSYFGFVVVWAQNGNVN